MTILSVNNEFNNSVKQHTAQCFSRASGQYGQYAKVQAKAAHLLLSMLRTGNKSLLDLGSGPLLHQQTLAHYADSIVNMDLSHSMLMQGEVGDHRICADMDNLPFQSQVFDVVFSNFAIQWSQNPAKLFVELARLCKPNGQVVLSSVLTGSLFEIDIAWHALDGRAHVNPFLALSTLHRHAIDAGFDVRTMTQECFVDEYPDAKAAIKSIKQIGANQLQTGRANKGLMGKAAYTKVLNNYPLTNGCAPVTYQVALMELIKR
ncbi:methyltransferase domain-containing protein [Pseudoalteromonas aurantia]|uniref:Dethiobiotin synthase n=1 Tax=Pseudoalteromonas aurantia TaxID=43654 RepID=A0ABY2VYA1_9GAMM|nr:methyltransferase domain-containing protein [Pseudoalteromonas aurantia]TMO60290.1 dethiobiotin synthase [Pseudoalteromonas aurantia]TMO74903.1 dethiobiotin synthase [Pseudoalteromonas aurantia]